MRRVHRSRPGWDWSRPVGRLPRECRRPARFRMPFFTGSSAPPVEVDAAQGANLGKEFPQCVSLQGQAWALCGLALATSAMVKADDPAPPPGDAAVPQAAQVTGHHHKGLFGWRHCVECQRAWAKKHDGVDVPPPPSSPAAAAMAGTIVHDHNQGTQCAACQAGTIVSGPVSVVESYPPGHAVVGGPVLAGNLPPGYAVVGGGGPADGGCGPYPGWRFAGRSDPMEQPSACLDAAAGGRCVL